MSEATEKQIGYAKTLGIDNPAQYSKEALKELISAKVGGSQPSKPKDVTSQYIPEAKPKQEFHLTPEQVRTNALDLALKLALRIEHEGTESNLMELAKRIEDYLWGK